MAKLLKSLDIDESKYSKYLIDGNLCEVETLDYYHEVKHLKKITELLLKHKQAIKNNLFKELKALLWEGNIKTITDKIRGLLKRSSKKINTEIAYFEKNEHRMNYPFYRKNKCLCGSSIIESGVRRIINLRFKSASPFWK